MHRQLPAYTPASPALAVASVAEALFSAGRARAELRDYLGRRFGAPQVLLTSSGTQALQVALRLTLETRGSERPVAVPAYGCYDLITAAVGARARVVFYDLDPTSLAPDPESLGAALRQGASAVVATPLHGFPLDWTWLRQECEAAGALLVEDSAQGLGSEWRGAEGGTFGDATVFSFGRGKGWSGAGGGALLLRHEGLRAAAGEEALPTPAATGGLKDFVASAALWLLGRPRLYALPSALPFLHLGVTTYKPPRPVMGPSAFAAASALRQADTALEAVETRRGWGAAWTRMLESDKVLAAITPCRVLPGGASGYLRFPVVALDRTSASVLLEVGRSAGVGPPYPMVLPKLEAAERLTVAAGPMPGAEELAQGLLTLPTHPRVQPRDLRTIEGILRRPSVDGSRGSPP